MAFLHTQSATDSHGKHQRTIFFQPTILRLHLFPKISNRCATALPSRFQTSKQTSYNTSFHRTTAAVLVPFPRLPSPMSGLLLAFYLLVLSLAACTDSNTKSAHPCKQTTNKTRTQYANTSFQHIGIVLCYAYGYSIPRLPLLFATLHQRLAIPGPGMYVPTPSSFGLLHIIRC